MPQQQGRFVDQLHGVPSNWGRCWHWISVMTTTIRQMTLMILHQMTTLMIWCEMATLTIFVLDNYPDELA